MRDRPAPQGAVCPGCGTRHGLLVDGRMPGHPYPGTRATCIGSYVRPDDPRLAALQPDPLGAP